METILSEKVAQLPMQPGVYRFFDEHGKLLYIGKATNLRSRVQSYFRESTQHTERKRYMVHQIRDVEVTVLDNEPEALLLETTLIKKHKPPFNVVMKDDKSFQYIHITDDVYPRLETTRRMFTQTKNGSIRVLPGRFFGPYISGRAVRRTLRLLKEMFHYCTTPPETKRGNVVFPKRPCLEYHLGRCVGPCADAISAEEYAAIFHDIEQFLRGEYEPVRNSVEAAMHRASEEQQFERAARLRDQLQAIDALMIDQKVVNAKRENADYLSLARNGAKAAVNVFTVRRGNMIHQEVFFLQHTEKMTDEEIVDEFRDQYYAQAATKPSKVYISTETRRGHNRKMLEMGKENAEQALARQKASFEKAEERAKRGLQQIGEAIGVDPESLGRIEVYDISNNQGKFTVSSMIVFVDGQPEKSQYRKFKIRTVEGPNDFASMKETLDRRLQHLPEKSKGQSDPWPRPDLIVIDGGKGQLSSAVAVLRALRIDIPIISLAKREEEIFLPDNPVSVRLPEGSDGLHLMQRMRDEAHRFAIGFYRSQHMKGLV